MPFACAWRAHDVYNAGALVEAAVRHYRGTGTRSLMDVAVRLVRHLSATMGPSPRLGIVPAHPLPEKALVDLYLLLRGDASLRGSYPELEPRSAIELALFWLDRRGRHGSRASYVPNLQSYAQDHEPLTRQTEAVGHAVRATLRYAGLTAAGRVARRGRYLRTALRLWNDVTTRKMHVTGGVGAMSQEEMFGPSWSTVSRRTGKGSRPSPISPGTIDRMGTRTAWRSGSRSPEPGIPNGWSGRIRRA